MKEYTKLVVKRGYPSCLSLVHVLTSYITTRNKVNNMMPRNICPNLFKPSSTMKTKSLFYIKHVISFSLDSYYEKFKLRATLGSQDF